MTRKMEPVFGGYSYLECPRWHDGRVWVSDFYTKSVLSAFPGTKPEVALEVPGQPSGLGWLPGGDLLVVSMKDRTILRWDGLAVTVHADLSDLVPSHLNDMVVDEYGRAYVGNFGSDFMHGEPLRATHLIRVDPDGAAVIVADDLLCPNGMVITPEQTLIVAESFAGRLTAFDIAPDGSLTGRRTLATLSEHVGGHDFREAVRRLSVLPDGLALDAEGGVWVADGIGFRALRILGGQIVDEVSTRTEGLLTIACALGGPDGRTLFLCANTTPVDERSTLATMGATLLAIEVDVPHAGHP